MKLKLDLHDIFNRGQEIDRALRGIIDEAIEKKAAMVEHFFRTSLTFLQGGLLPSGGIIEPDYLWETWEDTPFTPRAGFDIAPSVNVVVSDDFETARDALKPVLALYIGGMGARGANFYNALVCRYGYEAEAARIQELFLGGKHAEAAAAVPDALVDEVALCGPVAHIREQLAEWKSSGVTTIMVSGDTTAVRTMAELGQ